MVVLLLGGEANVALGPPGVARLSRIGVTHVSIFRDDQTLAVVLEGWAFHPADSAGEAIAAVGADLATTRTLHGVAQLAVEPPGLAEEAGQRWSVEKGMPLDLTEPDAVSAAKAPHQLGSHWFHHRSKEDRMRT